MNVFDFGIRRNVVGEVDAEELKERNETVVTHKDNYLLRHFSTSGNQTNVGSRGYGDHHCRKWEILLYRWPGRLPGKEGVDTLMAQQRMLNLICLAAMLLNLMVAYMWLMEVPYMDRETV